MQEKSVAVVEPQASPEQVKFDGKQIGVNIYRIDDHGEVISEPDLIPWFTFGEFRLIDGSKLPPMQRRGGACVVGQRSYWAQTEPGTKGIVEFGDPVIIQSPMVFVRLEEPDKKEAVAVFRGTDEFEGVILRIYADTVRFISVF